MSTKVYSQEQQTQIVYDAMVLTFAIQEEQRQVAQMSKQRYRDIERIDLTPMETLEKDRPKQPTRKIAKLKQIGQDDELIKEASKVDVKFEFRPQPVKPDPKSALKATLPVKASIGGYAALVALYVIPSSLISAASGAYSIPIWVKVIEGIFLFLPLLGLAVGGSLLYNYIEIMKGYKASLAQWKNDYDAAYNVAYNAALNNPDRLEAISDAEYQTKVNREAAEKQAKQEAIERQRKYDLEYDHNYAQWMQDVREFDLKLDKISKEREEWHIRKAHWESEQESRIAAVKQDIQYKIDALNNLYDITRQISVTYRELWILEWLYNDMDSSDHDIRYATELLDRDRQRCATENVGIRVQAAIEAATKVIHSDLAGLTAHVDRNTDAILQGNAIQAAQNDIAMASFDVLDEIANNTAQTNKSIGTNTLVGALQRWGINKNLKEINAKLG